MRAGVAALIALSALASCSVSVRSQRGALPEPTSKVGAGMLDDIPSDAPAQTTSPTPVSTPRPTLFVLTLNDQNHRHPSGIPVRITEPYDQTVLTDSAGQVKVTTPGVYKLHVVDGCTATIQVTAGGYATVGVAPNATKAAGLPVNWRHRYAPSSPVFASQESEWPVGKRVDITYTVVDRCRDDIPAKRVPYPSYVLRPSANLALIGTPLLRSDEKGRGTLSVRCKAVGRTQLDSRDSQNISDSLDLVGSAIGYGGRPRCVE